MDEALKTEAKALSINVSMYYMLPANKREAALRADIAREKSKKGRLATSNNCQRG